MYVTIATFIFLAASIVIPLLLQHGYKMRGKRFRTLLGVNVFSFFAIVSVFSVLLWSGNVFAAPGDAGTAAVAGSNGLGLIASALSVGLACIGAGIAVAAGSSAALGALSEDPKIMGRALIFVVLGEGIAIYGLVISIMILGKV